jgi:hypothetical protein
MTNNFIICDYCGKKKPRNRYEVRRCEKISEHVYCSKKCFHNSRMGIAPKNIFEKGNQYWKLRDSSKCGNRTGDPKPWNINKKGTFKKGHIVSDEDRLKMSIRSKGKHKNPKNEFKKGNVPWSKGRTDIYIGEENPNWRGGITPLNDKIRHSKEYNNWRTNIFKRDNYKCQICDGNNNILIAHHIHFFNKIMKENSIKTFEDAIRCTELWDKSNGITICKECHDLFHKYIKK